MWFPRRAVRRAPAFAGSLISVGEATWSTYAVPDSNALYVVDVSSSKIGRKQEFSLTLASGGLLTDSSSKDESYGASYVESTLKSLSSIVGSFFFGSAEKSGAAAPPICKEMLATVKDVRQKLLNLRGTVDSASTKEVLEFKEAKLKADLLAAESAFTGRTATVGKVLCDLDVASGATSLIKFTQQGGISSAAPGCTVPAAFQTLPAPPAACPAPAGPGGQPRHFPKPASRTT